MALTRGVNRAPTAPMPISAPAANEKYDRENENRWRQMVEQAIRDLSASTSVVRDTVDTLPVVDPFAPEDPSGAFPVSPILWSGYASGNGAGSLPPVIQLSNPANSGFYMLIWDVRAQAEQSDQNLICGIHDAVIAILTASPNRALVNCTPMRMDEADATSIVVVPTVGYLAASFTYVAQQIWTGRLPSIGASGRLVRPKAIVAQEFWTPEMPPLVILPGQVFSLTSSSSAPDIEATVIWDEIAL